MFFKEDNIVCLCFASTRQQLAPISQPEKSALDGDGFKDEVTMLSCVMDEGRGLGGGLQVVIFDWITIKSRAWNCSALLFLFVLIRILFPFSFPQVSIKKSHSSLLA